MARPRILLVDDELAILGALKTRLPRERPSWDVTFESDATRALEAARATAFDVVVADARMPHLDGPALLALVHAARPTTSRILLASRGDRGELPAVQQIVAKPCALPALCDAIERGLSLASLRCDRIARAQLGGTARTQFAADVVSDLAVANAKQLRAPANTAAFDPRQRRGAALVRRWLGGEAGEIGYAATLLRDCSGLQRPDASACLLDIWGVPRAIADAVRWHADVERAPVGIREIACAIHVADALGRGAPINSNAVVAAGLTQRVASWCLAA